MTPGSAIFFDLETTDTNPIGQIINFCFIKVGPGFEIEGECSGDIRLSPLQLPSPDAILANRTNVLEHQRVASYSEMEAMEAIARFFEKAVSESDGKVALVGYNSNRFDLPYLRTSLIRNGLNPYFGGKLAYKDLFVAAKKLSCFDRSFPRVPHPSSEGRISLSLETLCKHFRLLEGPQSHHSKDDVLLTISLAKLLSEEFRLDVRAFEAYEASALHAKPRTGDVVMTVEPIYTQESCDGDGLVPLTLLDANHRYALWIDLARFEKGQGERSIRWSNPGVHHLFLDREERDVTRWRAIAAEALEAFRGVQLSNFFKTSVCDIEQDIYRIDFDGIEALYEAIWLRRPEKLKSLKSRDPKVVFLRHQMANHVWGTDGDDRIAEMLKQYAIYRYGGRANISKSNTEPYKDGVYSNLHHVTFNELVARTDELLATATNADKVLLAALREFYFSSEIYRHAGDVLSRIERRKVDPSTSPDPVAEL